MEIKMPLIALLVLSCCCQELKTINPDIPVPKLIETKIPVKQQVIESGNVIAEDFRDINYEISYRFFMKNGTIDGDEHYQLPADSPLNRFCYLYPTSLDTHMVGQYSLSSIPVAYYHNQFSQKIYIITNDKLLSWYQYNERNLNKHRQIPIPPEVLPAQSDVVASLVEVQTNLYIFINQKVFFVNDTAEGVDYFVQTNGVESMDVRYSGIYHKQEGIVWMATSTSIYLYKINKLKFTLLSKFENITNEVFSAVMMCQKEKLFYMTTINKLHIIRIQGDNITQHEAFSLNGSCTSLTKVKDTLYLTCTYERINFVMELQIKTTKDQIKLNLNRFYDDRMIEGVHRVQPFGFDKILLIGGEQTLIIGQAVNRRILLDLIGQNNNQRRDLIFSFGLIDAINVQKLSNGVSSTVFILTTDAIKLTKVNQLPPQLWCDFKDVPTSQTVSALVIFNTTHCAYSRDDPSTIGGSNLVCQTYYEYEFEIGKRQYEKQTANITVFGIILLLIVLTLVCLGWCSKFRNNINDSIRKIGQKIKELKENKQELKQI